MRRGTGWLDTTALGPPSPSHISAALPASAGSLSAMPDRERSDYRLGGATHVIPATAIDSTYRAGSGSDPRDVLDTAALMPNTPPRVTAGA
jgi:hypothetical protein